MPSISATTTLLEALKRSIELWAPSRPWGVGYSGGRDSAVLLWGLAQLAPPGDLVALHVDHGWRSAAERAEEAAVVERWCRRLGVALVNFDPPSAGPRTEASARAYRYACFSTFTGQHPDSPVFLAHHADDQAETILMRVLRGRSWQGLAGMAAKRGPFLRPLLRVRASVLAEVALAQGVAVHQDSTNADTAYARNLLRHRVFPLLNERFPRAVEALVGLGRAWAQLAPGGRAADEWTWEPGQASVTAPVWDLWSPVERQAQLLAVVSRLSPGRVSRRFLETVAESGRTATAAGAGWAWSRDGGRVVWAVLAHAEVQEYFIVAEADRTYDTGAFQFQWSAQGGALAGALFVAGPDPAVPLVWRSWAPGMRLASADDPDWGKERRRRRLGTAHQGRCALLLQDALVRAVVDPLAKRVVWSETGPEKLHKTGIFVKLEQRSDYERR
jgi:tRNA(Ile)-lysidine synthetase-like protein